MGPESWGPEGWGPEGWGPEPRKNGAPKGEAPVWLKLFLLTRHIVDTCVEAGFLCLCILVKTDFTHGPQGMVNSRHSFGVVQCCAWTASTISSMATSAAVGAPVELSCSGFQSHRGHGGFSVKAQVAARQRSGESRQNAGRCTFAGGRIGESFFNSVRRRFRRNSWIASLIEGSPPCGSSRGMPSIHSTFTEEIGAFA